MIPNPIRTITENAQNLAKRLQLTAIVCHELKLIYFSIPKTASSSIKRYLRKHGYEPDRLDIDDLPAKEIHNFIYPRVAMSDVNRLRKDGYISIAVVRNPHVRLWSCYSDKIIMRKSEGRTMYNGFNRYNSLFLRELFHIDMDYPTFIRAVMKVPDFIADGHFRSQWRYLPVKGEKVEVDYIFDINKVDQQMTRITGEQALPAWEIRRVNKSPSSTSRPTLSEKDIELVCQRYARDFRCLGYETECPF